VCVFFFFLRSLLYVLCWAYQLFYMPHSSKTQCFLDHAKSLYMQSSAQPQVASSKSVPLKSTSAPSNRTRIFSTVQPGWVLSGPLEGV
jgi:hypothetical protein